MLRRPAAARPARGRLVGAIVLALAAAVILPLLLESDPKPLGDDVTIQIPPIDSGKFITPLSPPKGADAKASPDRPGTLTSAKPAPVAAGSPVDAKPAGALNASGAPVESAQRAPEIAPPAGSTATSMITATESQKP